MPFLTSKVGAQSGATQQFAMHCVDAMDEESCGAGASGARSTAKREDLPKTPFQRRASNWQRHHSSTTKSSSA